MFKRAFEIIIGHEGGYVDDPTDRGGETNYGVTKRFYPDEDIKNMTIARAEAIYYRDYWKTPKLDLDKIALISESLAFELFDTAINQGVSSSAKFLQEGLNLLNRDKKLFNDMKVDGWAGDTTFYGISKIKVLDRLVKVVNGLQFMRYYNIAKDDPTQERFFAGWIDTRI